MAVPIHLEGLFRSTESRRSRPLRGAGICGGDSVGRAGRRYPPLPLQGPRAAFDPGTLPGATRTLFLIVRFFGLVALVPFIEELFWRSFLIRWIDHPDFRRIPLGEVTLRGAAVTAALFALAHPEWLPALITGLLWAWLLRHTRSLTACLLSHGVANLALGIYVLLTGAWRFW